MTAKITLRAPSPPSVVIKVHECDTLVFSFPIWLICHSTGIPVRLQTESIIQAASHPALQHEQPKCQVGDIEVTQLMAVLETAHEQWPDAGVWPVDPLFRSRTRDACAGIVACCAGATPFLLPLPTGRVCVDPDLSRLVCSTMQESYAHEHSHRSYTVTALAVLAHLFGVCELLDRPSLHLVKLMLLGEAARAWFTHPSILRRSQCYKSGTLLNVGMQ